MRIMIDLDGTIAELKKDSQTYGTVRVNKGAVEKIRALKEAGHYIILQTARHMKTCNGDQGMVAARVGKHTFDWLAEHNIPYDEIYFGKPYADVYLDDLAKTFTGWDSINSEDFDDTKLNVLIPMAGAGSRFSKAGYTDPKPLIRAKGKTLIQWSIASLSFLKKHENYSLIFIIQKEHELQYKLGQQLKAGFGQQAKIITLDSVTNGQAETCLKAKPYINNFNQLLIYNCDTYTTGNEHLMNLVSTERPDGVLACFTARDPRYSYAHLDEFGYVDFTAEKEVVSEHASTGLYYFRRGSDFVAAAEAMMSVERTVNGEYYVAPCYNELLKSGKKVRIYSVKENWVLGTPEELEYFKTNYKK